MSDHGNSHERHERHEIGQETSSHEKHEIHERDLRNKSHERHERHEIGQETSSHEKHEKHERETKIILPEESYRIQGAIFEVYKELGSGFLEAVYQECLEREFTLRDIPFASQVELPLDYKGVPLCHTYRADLICFGSIIVEVKACSVLLPVHKAQVLNYLKATGMKLGLLINFNAAPRVEIERIIL